MKRFICAKCREPFTIEKPGHLLGSHLFRRCGCGAALLPRFGLDRLTSMTEAELAQIGLTIKGP
ncbi:hypothetical protein [Aeromonas phage 85AhydR10PP]|nr:hypothetical protein [Aeromonas phage 85AhydR10PP]